MDAMQAITQGEIDYQGSMTFLVKYGRHFNYLAEIAQKIT
jgi:hypothetical protein